MTTDDDVWADPDAVDVRLNRWWQDLSTSERRTVLDEVRARMPRQIAEGLKNVGLAIRPERLTSGLTRVEAFLTPPLMALFLDEKRRTTPQRRFRRRART